MIWSFSQSIIFRDCSRKWFLDKIVANSRSKSPLRREAFFLKKLQSVSAWRGSLVDQIISEEIVPSISNKSPLSLAETLSKARKQFDNQLRFAQEMRWRNPGVKTTDSNYVALYGYEYGQDITAELDQAWLDIEQALNNFFAMDDLWEKLRNASYLIPQRTLRFQHYGIWVRCQPDLIVLYEDDLPIIIDWKVRSFDLQDYRLQLALYAIALVRSNLRTKYPAAIVGSSARGIDLLEVQLLTKKQRDHSPLSEAEVGEVESYISSSALNMALVKDDKPTTFFDVPTTMYPEVCNRCQFRALCWEGSRWEKETLCQESQQTFFLC